MKDLEAEIAAYQRERNWDQIAPADLAKSIMIEGAELLEHFQWENHSVEAIHANPELKEKLKKELADVMIYAIQFGLRLDIDTSEAIKEKLALVRIKYPVDGVTDGVSGDDFYMEQKIKYRTSGIN